MQVTEVKSSLFSASLKALGEIVQGIDHVNQNIIIVLKTRKRSDPLRPDFGCDILDKLDKPIDQVRTMLVADVKTALNIWMPEITVVKITSALDVGILMVAIQWAFTNVIDTKQVEKTYGVTVNYNL